MQGEHMARSMYILYPERRWITEAQVRQWARDLWEDQEGPECAAARHTLEECMDFLEDQGVVTFSRTLRTA